VASLTVPVDLASIAASGPSPLASQTFVCALGLRPTGRMSKNRTYCQVRITLAPRATFSRTAGSDCYATLLCPRVGIMMSTR
jgi:hypothetical protein